MDALLPDASLSSLSPHQLEPRSPQPSDEVYLSRYSDLTPMTSVVSSLLGLLIDFRDMRFCSENSVQLQASSGAEYDLNKVIREYQQIWGSNQLRPRLSLSFRRRKNFERNFSFNFLNSFSYVLQFSERVRPVVSQNSALPQSASVHRLLSAVDAACRGRRGREFPKNIQEKT